MDTSEDIQLAGRPYRIDITSYRDKDLADFSPRASVPGGSISQSELMLYQPLNLTDWRHGIGFQWHTDAMGYMYSMGNIDTRQPGIAMLFTSPTAIQDTGDTVGTKIGMCLFNSAMYTWGSTGLRKWDGATWTSIYSAGAVNCVLPTGDYLFFCPNNGRIQKMDTNGNITNAGLDIYAGDYKWLCIHKGYIYAGKDGERRIHYASEEDLSDLEGGGPKDGENEDAALINVGAGKFPTLGATSYGQELFIFRKDGVWVLGSDNIARRILDYSSESSDDNFKGYCIFNGYLYFSVRNKIFQWNGSRLVDVTPPRITDQFPYSEIKTIGPMLTANNFLYMLANWEHQPITTEYVGYYGSGTFTSLFCYDGVGWHKLADLVYSDGLPGTSCMCYDGDNNKLYFSIGNSVAASRYDGYFAMGTTNLPSAPYQTGAGTNVLLSSRLDMGFRRVKKFSPSLMIEASNIYYDPVNTSSNHYLKLYAIFGVGENDLGVDELAYVFLGDVIHNGINEIYLPGISLIGFPMAHVRGAPRLGIIPGVEMPSQRYIDVIRPAHSVVKPFVSTYNYVILLVEFITEDNTESPILEGLTMRFLLRPNVFYGYNFNVVAADNMVYGDTIDTRTATQIVAELKAIRDSKVPVDFVDIYGNTVQVYVSSVTNQGIERHENHENEMHSIESFVNLNLVECK